MQRYCESYAPKMERGDEQAMAEFLGLLYLVGEPVGVRALSNAFVLVRRKNQRRLISALERDRNARRPTIVGKAVDAAFELRMTNLLDEVAKDPAAAKEVGPALRSALARFHRSAPQRSKQHNSEHAVGSPMTTGTAIRTRGATFAPSRPTAAKTRLARSRGCAGTRRATKALEVSLLLRGWRSLYTHSRRVLDKWHSVLSTSKKG